MGHIKKKNLKRNNLYLEENKDLLKFSLETGDRFKSA